ncbi:UvrD-helicase domain-containing protein [Rhodococcus sp. NPDC059968]|uniref:UvrD-helicase domain-containing protein n=1 Tax=Rhodococcus sp. NPDC059968 TaxID=3347017 RepID=UPI00367104D9
MLAPTLAQQQIRDYNGLSLLAIAPAGCGKTEALALRIQGLLTRSEVVPPRKILVTTFSNRARDNIRERLQAHTHPAQLRDRVTIANFHGLAARIVRAHATVVGVDPSADLPESDWVGEQCRRLGLQYKAIGVIQNVLRDAKQEPLDDGEVEQLLIATGNVNALNIERQRRQENRLTYDDLPRLAELILQRDGVADLYRNHFAAVVVDEFQDLTPQQLRIINRIGYQKTTYAGDVAQGIYGFAGARPTEIDKAVRVECSSVFEFSDSHRSAPAVLGMVNSLTSLTGGQQLNSAAPGSWPSGGLSGLVASETAVEEADWAMKFSRYVLDRAPLQRIGIVARIASRRRFVDEAIAASGLAFHRWDDGVLDTDTAKRMKGMLAQLDTAELAKSSDPLGFLRVAANLEAVQDPGGREALAGALTWCNDLLAEGHSPAAIRSRIRIGDNDTLITVPGVHLLTGHVGKGQQFDWVIVIGAEEGSIPDFRATSMEDLTEEARILSVMISRARHGVIVMHAQSVPAASSGVAYSKQGSRFLSALQKSNPIDSQGVVEWVQTVDWDAVVVR